MPDTHKPISNCYFTSLTITHHDGEVTSISSSKGAPPLEGITVVSLEQAVAAPFATRQLADLGARVIKIERPGPGDFARGYDETVHGNASYFVWLNRAKESLTLDVKQPAGQAILRELIGRADVFVQNLGPGAARRLGFDAAALRARHKDLITCTISGWGTDGPQADRKAYDLLVQCETGLVSLTGTPEHMAKAGISVADIAAGMYAYSGILTALLRRATRGEASDIEVSLFDALAEWMGAPLYYTAGSGRPPVRAGAAHATIAPYGPYRSADGIVLIAIQNAQEWLSLCTHLLQDGDLADDPRFAVNSARVAHRPELDELMDGALRKLTSAQVTEILDRAGIANARINTIDDFLSHPVLAERNRWQDIGVPGGPGLPGGTVRALRPPADLSGVDPVMGPVPAVGEHTSTILRELGRDEAEIEALRASAAV
jgi:formyl-CoA transferase